ncbi:MAG: C-terminal target protein [Bacteroidetes bacterium]|nr:C-terminal target protein [Bacteroidota bacterium]
MKLLPTCFLAGLGLLSSFSFAQRGKDGNVTINTANRIVNEYTSVSANVAAGATSISVTASGLNANGRFTGNLAPGDLIMIIQMQGATILGQPDAGAPTISDPNDPTWGDVTSYNNSGRYEYAEVLAVPNATTITVDCGLTNSYTATGKTQVVRVPRYNTLTLTAPCVLTCQVWNGTSGGVLAVEVLGATTMNAGSKINTTGTGFRGGAVFTTTGRTTTTLYSCVSLDVGTNKGEGIAGYDTDYTPYGGKFCRAAPANAGGGGNVWNTGGGGGGNAGNTAAWTGQGNPNTTGAGWAAAWNLESPGFAASTSSGGGRGGYSFSSSNQNATTLGPGTPGVTNAWGGSYRYNLGGLGGRPLDYSGGRIFLGGGGGAGEQDNGQAGAGGKGGGIIYFVTYGAFTGTGNDSIISDGAVGGSTNIAGSNPGKDAGGGAGGGGTIILNTTGTVSGVAIRANGGIGGFQLQNTSGFFNLTEAEGPGGGGGGGYIAVANGTPVQQANGGNSGYTQSSQLSEFLPNGATMGGTGLTGQTITNFTITASNVTICSGNTATLTAALAGTVPPGTTITWWNAQTGGSVVGSGASFTTPALASTTTYYVGTCPGTYRIPVVVTVNPGLTVTVTSQTICSGGTATLTASGGTTYTWTAGATPTGANTATASPASTTTYTVTGTTGSCTGTAVATVSVNPAPVATFSYTGTPYCQNAANPSPTFSGGGVAGTFTSTAGLSITAGTGAVNLAASTPGTYTVTNTIPAAGGCPAATATSSITITAQPVATFNYAATPYCQSAANPSPTFSGGGVAGTFSSTAGLSINSATGQVNLLASTPGTYTVTNTIAASGGCPTITATSPITITAQPVATFSYTGTPYCKTAANPSPTFSGGGVAGTFTSTAGLSITAGTGVVNLAASTAGTYTVTNTIPASGGCPATTATATITITAQPVATFSYTGTPYCQSAANPSPTFSGGGVAGTFTSTAGLSINAATGAVNLLASTPGTYTVTNTIAASGGCATVTATSPITITAQPVATFSYTATPYCQSAANPSPTFSGGGVAGTFTSTAGLSITAGTGVVNLAASTPGTYTVTNTIPAAGGCPAATATASITITAQPVATFSYTGTPYCQNAANPSPTFSGGGVAGTFTSPAGLSINAATGAVNLLASTPGTYTVTNTIAASGGCAAVTATSPITITAQPVATFSYTGTPYCQSAANPSPTFSGGGVAGTFTSTAGLSITAGTGVVNLAASTPGTYTVTNTIPASGGCAAVTATVSITITAQPVASFSYTGTPYCQSAANPSPAFSGGGVAGTFTSTAGLSITAGTGVVNLAASTPGTYTVTNTIAASGGCAAVTATSGITITAPQTAGFSYTASPYCQDAADPSPVIGAGSVAGTFTSTAGLSINSASGLVNLAGSTAGTYTVTNTLAASGGCPAVTATSSITITPVQSAAFNYPSSTFCVSGTDPTPTITGTPGGTFSASPAGITINASTGTITLISSALNTYSVTYTTAGPCPSSSTINITITNAPAATFSYTGTPYCQSGTDPLPAFSGGGTAGTFTSTAGLVFVSSGTGEVDLSASTPGTYTVTNTIPASGGCASATASSSITITAPAIASFSYTGTPYCQNGTDPSPVLAAGGTAGTFSSTAGLSINASTGLVDLSASTAGTYTVINTVGGSCGNTDSTTITITVPPDATITQPSTICVSAASFNLSAATGGGAWTGTGITDGVNGTFDPATAGIGAHVITYTLSGSCGATDTVTVNVSSLLDATITTAPSTCVAASSFNLSAATGGGTWSGTGVTNGASGTFDPSVAGIGTFTVTYTISGSCGNSDTALVTVTSNSNATITQPAAACQGASPFNLTAATAGGTWSGTGITDSLAGTFDPSVAGAGTYTVTYTISGSCAANDTVIVTVNTAANASITPVTNVCVGATAFNLTAATGGGAWTGTGITDAANGTFDPATAGVGGHVITYTISGSCAATDTVTVNVTSLLDATIANATPVCIGAAPFNLSAATGGGTWSGTGITDAVNGTFTPSTAGTGTFTITYTISGSCGNTDTVHVTVTAPLNATINSVTPVCAGTAAFNLTAATAGGTWSGTGITNAAAGTFDPAVSGAGTFVISYGISGACGDTATQSITVNALPSPVATPDITSGCAPVCVQFTESVSTTCSSLSYDFGDGATSGSSNPTHCYTAAGTYGYSITCTDANGCVGTTTVPAAISVSPVPVAAMSVSPSGVVPANTAITFTDISTSGGSQAWDFGDPASASNTSFLSSDIHTYANEGTYCVTLVSANTSGCADTASECIVVANDATVNIPNIFTPNGDGNNDVFFISSTGVKELTCTIYDRWGLKIAELSSVNAGWDGRTTSGNIASDGVYYFILDIKGLNDKTIEKQGFVQLLSK